MIKTNKRVFLLRDAPPHNDLKLPISALLCSVRSHWCDVEPTAWLQCTKKWEQRSSWYKKSSFPLTVSFYRFSKLGLQSCVCFHKHVVLRDYVKTKTAGQWCSVSPSPSCNVEIKEHTYDTIITLFLLCHESTCKTVSKNFLFDLKNKKFFHHDQGLGSKQQPQQPEADLHLI